MKKLTDSFHELLVKFKLSKPVPPDIQEHILDSRKSSLVKHLKEKDDYSFFTGLSISFNIFLRKFGIRMSNKKSSLTLMTLSMAATGIIIAGIFTILDFDFFKQQMIMSDKSLVILTHGSINLKRNGKALEKVEIRDNLQIGDNIDTGKESLLMMQLEDRAIISLMPHTSVVIKKINENKSTEILLNEGLVICKVKGVPKGLHFIVKTPNSVTEVKGTEFSVHYKHGRSVIALGKGRVQVNKIIDEGKKIIDDRYSAIVTDKIIIRKISRIELLEIKKITGIPVDSDLINKSKEEMKKSEARYLKQIKQIDKEIKILMDEKNKRLESKNKDQIFDLKEIPPLERLRKQGKIITMFVLVNGSKLAGNIVSQNEDQLKLDTADGIITIPKNDIIRRKQLK